MNRKSRLFRITRSLSVCLAVGPIGALSNSCTAPQSFTSIEGSWQVSPPSTCPGCVLTIDSSGTGELFTGEYELPIVVQFDPFNRYMLGIKNAVDSPNDILCSGCTVSTAQGDEADFDDGGVYEPATGTSSSTTQLSCVNGQATFTCNFTLR